MSFITLSFTGFVFANSYEITTLKDLPYITAVKTLYVPALSKLVEGGIDPAVKPEKIIIQPTGTRLPLSKSIVMEDKVLQVANRAHYSVKKSNPIYSLGDSYVYTVKSWRTIESVDKVKEGDYIFLFTDKQKISYKVQEISVKDFYETYLNTSTNNPTLIFVVIDIEKRNLTYIKSLAVSKEEI